ncbi:hypothetical protein E1176_19365 [Fulvivirga sp. RKSG066]|uniref:hypothetical protein n=1 Tax=Fulvivirga aurantia TaxID=2529383 RepID=UPI0012BB797B|nr:hypothetical protein [Fulvivirga aurantia]MTI23198.1 hypothetical protein [Fulvivirga aurantia]
MKTYNIKFFLFILGLTVLAACETDYESPLEEFDRGATVKAILDPEHSSINLLGDVSTATVEFEIVPFDENGQNADLIESLEISVQFLPADTAGGKRQTDEILVSTETTFNKTVVYEVPDLVDLIPGLTTTNLGPSDVFRFSFNVITSDGREFGPSNTASQICGTAGSNGTCTFDVPVTCPSDNESFAGEYSSVITASNFGGFVGSTNPSVTIAFAGPEEFRYSISDITSLAYVPFGGTAYATDFVDICGTPSFTTVQTFGATSDTGGGTWDPENGVLTFNAFEANNGLTWTVVLTKK